MQQCVLHIVQRYRVRMGSGPDVEALQRLHSRRPEPCAFLLSRHRRGHVVERTEPVGGALASIV